MYCSFCYLLSVTWNIPDSSYGLSSGVRNQVEDDNSSIFSTELTCVALAPSNLNTDIQDWPSSHLSRFWYVHCVNRNLRSFYPVAIDLDKYQCSDVHQVSLCEPCHAGVCKEFVVYFDIIVILRANFSESYISVSKTHKLNNGLPNPPVVTWSLYEAKMAHQQPCSSCDVCSLKLIAYSCVNCSRRSRIQYLPSGCKHPVINGLRSGSSQRYFLCESTVRSLQEVMIQPSQIDFRSLWIRLIQLGPPNSDAKKNTSKKK